MHDAADDPPIIGSLDAADIGRQMRLDPRPLLVAQPKQVLAHDPDPLQRISTGWNQDCLTAASQLMSSNPRRFGRRDVHNRDRH
jgi:hypothetical protein